MAAMLASPLATSALDLTEQAILIHNAIHTTSATTATVIAENLAPEVTLFASKASASDIQDLSQSSSGPAHHRDDASSALSSVPSSDLSSLSSDEDAKPARKRRRKVYSTPGTSIDEPSRKSSNMQLSFKPSMCDYDTVDRKDYLRAGLYSGATNSMSGTGRVKSQQKVDAKGRIQLSRPIDEITRTFKFGIPLFHGESLLGQHRTFRLPWDILSDFDLSRLPETPEALRHRSDALDRVGTQMKPTSYKSISQNRLTWRTKDEAERLAICDCPAGDCGDSCLNRIMQFFCSSKLCKSGKECTNLPFSMRPSPKHDLQVFWTGNRGFGLRTNSKIAAGAFVMQYVGEIITINESYRRTVEDYKDRHDYYFLHYYDAEVVDAGHMGNESRFINHSCDPNLHVVRWKLADYDEYQIGLFAMREIDAEEELTYDYGWQAFSSIDSKDAKGDGTVKGEVEKQRCLCAGPSCTGFLEKAEKMKKEKVALMDKASRKGGLKRSQSNSSKSKKAQLSI